MSIAYIDTSFVIGAAIGDTVALSQSHLLERITRLVSSTFLEAEARSVYARNEVDFPDELLSGISFIMPQRVITKEISEVLTYFTWLVLFTRLSSRLKHGL